MLINDALTNYLIEFHCTRDYFECHEILEEYWKSLPQHDGEAIWVGLIQVAVAQYHHRRGNVVGAERMYLSAKNIIEKNRKMDIGIDLEQLIDSVSVQLNRLAESFDDINIEITNEDLNHTCRIKAASLGLEWETSSGSVSIEIKDKHKRRDRSSVIAEREQSRLLKMQLRQSDK